MWDGRSIARLCLRATSMVLALVCFGVRISFATTIVYDVTGDAAELDIEEVSGGYTDSELIFTARFAPGTFDPLDAQISWRFDTDFRSQPEGDVARDSDSTVLFNSEWNDLRGRTAVRLYSDVFGTGSFVELPITLEVDSAEVRVPLDVLGSIDGQVLFAFDSGLPINRNAAIFRDVAGVPSLDDRLTVMTTPVPEPATGTLVVLGLFACERLARRPRRRDGSGATAP